MVRDNVVSNDDRITSALRSDVIIFVTNFYRLSKTSSQEDVKNSETVSKFVKVVQRNL